MRILSVFVSLICGLIVLPAAQPQAASAVFYGADCRYAAQTGTDGTPRAIAPHQNRLYAVLEPSAIRTVTRNVYCTIPDRPGDGDAPGDISAVHITGGPLQARLCFSSSRGGTTCGRAVSTEHAAAEVTVPLPEMRPAFANGAFLTVTFRSRRAGLFVGQVLDYRVSWTE